MKIKMNTKNIVAFLTAVIAVVAVFLCFLPFAKTTVTVPYVGTSVTEYKGFDVIFGNEDTPFSFSVGGLVIFVFMILVALMDLFKVVAKKKNRNGINCLVFLLSVVAAVLCFLSATRVVLNVTDNAWNTAFLGFNFGLKDYISLGLGAIVDGILMIVTALGALADVYVFKK